MSEEEFKKFNEGRPWTRDRKPYLVMPCIRCKNHFYVNLTKGYKTKTCPRCKKRNTVDEKRGKIVEGMTAAVETVQEKQNELAVQELGKEPDFEVASGNFFETPGFQRQGENSENSENSLPDNEAISEEEACFLQILSEIAREYEEFPIYLIEYKAKEKGLPIPEVKILLRKYLKNGTLTITCRKKYIGIV